MYTSSRNQFRNYRHLELIVVGLALTLLTFFFLSLMFYFKSAKPLDFTYEPVTVQQGDTLWELAAKTNDNIDTNTLVNRTMKYNNLSNTYIQPGQVIYVPFSS